jgi:hypothetical protein
VLAKDESGDLHIVTKYDVLQALVWIFNAVFSV